jgi:hypothetical protein
MGDKLTILIGSINAIAAACYACEVNWPKFLYFAGASILTAGVLLMK